MASSSSPPLSVPKRYHVFPSSHGADVRKTFLSHLHKYFEWKGITVYKDNNMERCLTIKRELRLAIRESRVLIVLLSKNYASSIWCLDELVDIMECRKDKDYIVMPIFYEVDPSDVRKQSGDFGSTFKKICEGKDEEEKQRWSKALTDVASLGGHHSLNSNDEAQMIKKIATDVSKKLTESVGSKIYFRRGHNICKKLLLSLGADLGH